MTGYFLLLHAPGVLAVILAAVVLVSRRHRTGRATALGLVGIAAYFAREVVGPGLLLTGLFAPHENGSSIDTILFRLRVLGWAEQGLGVVCMLAMVGAVVMDRPRPQCDEHRAESEGDGDCG